MKLVKLSLWNIFDIFHIRRYVQINTAQQTRQLKSLTRKVVRGINLELEFKLNQRQFLIDHDFEEFMEMSSAISTRYQILLIVKGMKLLPTGWIPQTVEFNSALIKLHQLLGE
jgi:hypothetical protein